MIWKLIRRNVSGKPFRFLLTCSAVTAGVMFTVGVFVFTDGMRRQFAELAEDIEGDVDVAVRTYTEFGDGFSRPPFDTSVADTIRAVPGVVGVQPRVLKFNVVPEDGDGNRLLTRFGPNIGLNWEDETPFPRLFIQEGRPPKRDGEFALDTRAFGDGNFEIGGTYNIQTPTGPLEHELVGTFNFASPTENLLIGDTKQVAFATETAVDLLNAGAGYDQVTFTIADGFARATVLAAVEAALPSGLEVVDGLQLVEEQDEDFGDIIGIFRTVLLAFAIIILAVSAFVIYNVFTILIGQRIRELGLLRAVGAGGNQVTRVLLAEALFVGIVSTVLGIAAGIAFGAGMGWLLGQLEFGPGADQVVVRSWTILWGTVLGIVVTMASATVPALRARHISPMAALREDARLRRVVPPRNLAVGVPVVVVGWVLLGIGLSAGDWRVVPVFGFLAAFANTYGLRRIHDSVGRFAMLGFGVVTIVLSVVLDLPVSELLLLLAVAAVTLFLGINAISPALARPVSNVIGRWPLAVLLGIGGVVICLLGVGAILGSLFLLGVSFVDVITDFDLAGVLAVPALLISTALGAGVLILGIRTVDASFILGWRLRHVALAVGLFVVAAVGAVLALTGFAGLVTGRWAQVLLIPGGAIGLAFAIRLRQLFLPRSMKSNARMARENASRNPRRTASAAAALMIGVALVSTATVVTESFKATFADVLADRVISDWFISSETGFNPAASFSRELAAGLDALPEIESAISFRYAFEGFRLTTGDSTRDASSVEMITSLDHFDPGFVDIDRSLIGPEALWLHQDVASDTGLWVGDALSLQFADGSLEPVRIAAIYEDLSIYGSSVVDLSMWERHFPTAQDQFVSLLVADEVDGETARTAITGVSGNYPVNVDTREELQKRQEGTIDRFLQIFTVLLLAAIAVALLGISITLALSVFERTRELGLVRAVGMTSRQMMRMVLFEGAIIAAFGGFLGVALGAVFGSAAVTVIPDTFISSLAIPVDLLVMCMALASVFGVGAAIIPARRASRLNVLDAISQD